MEIGTGLDWTGLGWMEARVWRRPGWRGALQCSGAGKVSTAARGEGASRERVRPRQGEAGRAGPAGSRAAAATVSASFRRHQGGILCCTGPSLSPGTWSSSLQHHRGGNEWKRSANASRHPSACNSPSTHMAEHAHARPRTPPQLLHCPTPSPHPPLGDTTRPRPLRAPRYTCAAAAGSGGWAGHQHCPPTSPAPSSLPKQFRAGPP